jgi:hypothetical protein
MVLLIVGRMVLPIHRRLRDRLCNGSAVEERVSGPNAGHQARLEAEAKRKL